MRWDMRVGSVDSILEVAVLALQSSDPRKLCNIHNREQLPVTPILSHQQDILTLPQHRPIQLILRARQLDHPPVRHRKDRGEAPGEAGPSFVHCCRWGRWRADGDETFPGLRGEGVCGGMWAGWWTRRRSRRIAPLVLLVHRRYRRVDNSRKQRTQPQLAPRAHAHRHRIPNRRTQPQQLHLHPRRRHHRPSSRLDLLYPLPQRLLIHPYPTEIRELDDTDEAVEGGECPAVDPAFPAGRGSEVSDDLVGGAGKLPGGVGGGAEGPGEVGLGKEGVGENVEGGEAEEEWGVWVRVQV